jgi:hypothetical protein
MLQLNLEPISMAAGACPRRRYKIYYSSIVYFFLRETFSDFYFSLEAIQIKLLILTPKCLQLKTQEIKPLPA